MHLKEFFCLLALVNGLFLSAQESNGLKVTTGRMPNSDTLWVSATMDTNARPGSLMVVTRIEDLPLTDTFYYPLIESENYYEFLVPKIYQNRTISIDCFFYPSVFQIRGVVNSDRNLKQLQVYMMTDNESSFSRVIDVHAGGNNFSLPKLVYQNKASVFFNYVGKKGNQKPDVTIYQFPKSSDFTNPVASAKFEFGSSIVTGFQYDSLKRKGNAADTLVLAEGKGKTLEEVVVTGSRRYKLNQYIRENVSGRFSNNMGRDLDCLTNDDILRYPDLLSYVRSNATVRVSKDQDGRDVVIWQGQEIAGYFVDEIETDFFQIRDLDIRSVALISLIPPSLVGPDSRIKGSILAVYTRKGKDMRPATFQNNWIFAVRGYAPANYVLFSQVEN